MTTAVQPTHHWSLPHWNKRLTPYFGLALVLITTFAFRFPSLWEPPWYDDEGIYAAVAHAILRGGTLYRDVLDNRPPGIYWLYAAMLDVSNYSMVFIRLMATLSFLLTQVMVFLIARRLWNVKTGLMAISLLGVMGSLPFMEGNIANAEIYMMLPTSFGIYLALRGRFFVAGIAFALALLIKQIAGVEAIACVLALLLFQPRPLRHVAAFLLGYATPIAATVAYLVMQGSFGEFVFAGFGYYFGYVQRATRIPTELWPVKFLLLFAVLSAIWWHYGSRRTTQHFQLALVYFWVAFAVFGALFTARPYPHYLLQPLPPLALLIAVILVANWSRPLPQVTVGKVASVSTLSVACSWLFLAIYMPWPNWAKPEKTVEYYQNFVQYVSGQKTLSAYNDFFDKRVNRNMSLVRYLQRHAKPGEYLMIWGEEPWLYALSRLQVAAPFTVSYYAYEMPSGLDRMVNAVEQRKPKYIVWTTNKPLYPKLKAELDKDYSDVSLMENLVVFQRTTTLTSVANPVPLQERGSSSP